MFPFRLVIDEGRIEQVLRFSDYLRFESRRSHELIAVEFATRVLRPLHSRGCRTRVHVRVATPALSSTST